MPDCYPAALEYAQRGWAVFPCKRGSKEPATAHGCKDASRDAEQLRRWFDQQDVNIGIATGAISRLVVLDIDVKHGVAGPLSLEALEAEYGALPLTVSVRTPSGGTHHYFQLPDGLQVPCAVNLRPGVDVRGDGGYVLAPPSTLP